MWKLSLKKKKKKACENIRTCLFLTLWLEMSAIPIEMRLRVDQRPDLKYSPLSDEMR